MNDSTFIRLRLVIIGLLVFSGLIVIQLLRLEFGGDSVTYLRDLSATMSQYQREFAPERGYIYDRDGELLAGNDVQYELGLSPAYVVDPKGVARVLSEILGRSVVELELLTQSQRPYELLARPLSADLGARIKQLQAEGTVNLGGVNLVPLPHRVYPGNVLGAQTLGFVGYNSDGRQTGYFGVEGYYNNVLAGKAVQGTQWVVPFDVQPDPVPDQGSHLHLTLDRDIQFLTEGVLRNAVEVYGADGGSILVMDPRTGEILAMASWPTYNPNDYATNPPGNPQNPVVSGQYEPGSTFKVLTLAAAIDSGVVEPTSPFYDRGFIEVGGIPIRNWNGGAWGATDMTGCMEHSLNVCMAYLSTQMGPSTFYNYMRAFGMGQALNVDLAAEARGRLKVPGDPDWFESDLGTNAFGQGVATTPLQLVAAVSAVANNGVLMQPHMLRQVQTGGRLFTTQPQVLGRPIRPETAQAVSNILAVALERGEGKGAAVPGYRLAGKTGTAQIPVPGGYDSSRTIASFVGWGPVDDPRFVVLVKLDRPSTSIWGSDTAAPTFGALVRRLVVLMNIPPDDVRRTLGAR